MCLHKEGQVSRKDYNFRDIFHRGKMIRCASDKEVISRAVKKTMERKDLSTILSGGYWWTYSSDFEPMRITSKDGDIPVMLKQAKEFTFVIED